MTRAACLARIREDGKTVLLSFSRGKDSVATWLVLKAAGFKVVPFHMELIPGLRFVEESLRYYERFFKARIYRVTHPTLYHWLRTLQAQPPERREIIELLDLPRFTYADVNQGVKDTEDVDDNTWTAIGTRMTDSPIRRMVLATHGPINFKARQFYPIFDMKKDELIATLARSGVKLPFDYEMFGRSFDGVDYRFLAPMKELAPDDYARVLEWLPLMDMELYRARLQERHA